MDTVDQLLNRDDELRERRGDVAKHHHTQMSERLANDSLSS
jgi:hypothetical protein